MIIAISKIACNLGQVGNLPEMASLYLSISSRGMDVKGPVGFEIDLGFLDLSWSGVMLELAGTPTIGGEHDGPFENFLLRAWLSGKDKLPVSLGHSDAFHKDGGIKQSSYMACRVFSPDTDRVSPAVTLFSSQPFGPRAVCKISNCCAVPLIRTIAQLAFPA
jgi:hypothetical protein